MNGYRKIKVPLVYKLKDSYSRAEQWRLAWIGGNFFKYGKMYSIFYFAPHDTAIFNDAISNENENIVEIKLESYMQAHFCIGCIFDRAGQLISKPAHDQNYHYCNYEISGSLEPKNGFPIKKMLSDIPESALASKMSYFEIQDSSGSERLKIIIPVLEICRYFYFNYPVLARHILDYKFSQILYAPQINCRKGTVTYDNKLVAYFEIEKIVQFLFMEENLGLKSINKIGADIRFRRIADRQAGKRSTYYPDTVLPFKGRATMKFYGKPYSNDGEKYLFVNQIDEIFPIDLPEELILSIDVRAQFPQEHKYSMLLRKRNMAEDYNLSARLEKELLAEQKIEKKFGYDYFTSDTPLLLCLSQTHIIYGPSKITSGFYVANLVQSIMEKSPEEKNQQFVQRYSELIVDLISRVLPAEFMKLEGFKIKENRHSVHYKNRSREVIIAEIKSLKGYFYIINFASDFSVLVSNSISLGKFREIDLRLAVNKFVIDYFLDPNGNRKYLWDKRNEYKRKYRISIHEFILYNHKSESEMISRAESDSGLIIDKIRALEEAIAS